MLRLFLFTSLLFILACNNGAHKSPETIATKINEADYLKIPPHCKIIDRYRIPLATTTWSPELILIEFQDTVVGEPVGGFGNVWLITSKPIHFGWIREIAKTDTDGASGKPFISPDIASSFDSIKPNDKGYIIVNNDTADIFPARIDSILLSPDGKYIALSVGQVESADMIDIIDTHTLTTTGFYDVVGNIALWPGNEVRMDKWDGDKLIVESEANLVSFNTHAELSMSDNMDSLKAFSYDVGTKKFALYKTIKDYLNSPYLKTPTHCAIDSAYDVYIPSSSNGPSGELTIIQYRDSNIRKDYIDMAYRNKWLLNISTGRTFHGSSALGLHEIPNEAGDSDVYEVNDVSFNDKRGKDLLDYIIERKDTFYILPAGIYQILPSPDGKYIALLEGEIEAAPTLAIIDAPSFLKTGHYNVIKRLRMDNGDVTKLIKWDNGKLIMNSHFYLTHLNTKAKLDSSDNIADYHKEKCFSYNVEKKVFEEYLPK